MNALQIDPGLAEAHVALVGIWPKTSWQHMIAELPRWELKLAK